MTKRLKSKMTPLPMSKLLSIEIKLIFEKEVKETRKCIYRGKVRISKKCNERPGAVKIYSQEQIELLEKEKRQND